MDQPTDRNLLPHFKNFLLKLKDKEYSEETIYNYKRDLQTFENYLKRTEKKFSELNEQLIKNYKSTLTSQKRYTAKNKKSDNQLSKSSVNRMLSSLRSYLEFLKDKDKQVPIQPNKIKLIKTKGGSSQLPEFKKLTKLVGAPIKIENDNLIALRNQAMLEVLFSTGIRISELIDLKREDLDGNGTLFIREKQSKGRIVNLSSKAQKTLDEYLQIRGKDKYPYLFIPFRGKNASKKNKHISPNYLQEKIKEYREKLDIKEPISAKSFKTAYVAYLAEQNNNPPVIKDIRRHKTINTNQYKPFKKPKQSSLNFLH